MNEYKQMMSDGFELNYCMKGKGKPVLVVGSSIYYPRLFSEQLYQHFQFIFMDHRGFVRPPRTLERENYQLDQILADIEKLRAALQLEDIVILGHSGHAFMALEYAKKFPKHVDKVVLLNSAPSNSMERQQGSQSCFEQEAEPERKAELHKNIALLQSDIEKDPERRFVHMCLRMGAMSFYDYQFDASDTWDGVYTNMKIIDYLWGEAFATLDVTNGLSELNKPILLGLGKYDYLVAPTTLWDPIVAKYPAIQKVIFERSGHNPMLEEKQHFNEILINFIKH
ncbi:alpha/beta fold hydrolase [Bacillus sp. Hm123]|uniref:alpha/beta fold hydrolase n=1 Tax=Bacillus sp. Hm123 TaxID=3450745 RepID=UPI003F423186